MARYDQNKAVIKPLFYLVQKSIGIKLSDVSKFDMLLTGLITNGVNNVQGIDFRTSALQKYKDQARAMAVKAAKELGVKVGKPYSMSINDEGGWSSWSRGNGNVGFNSYAQNSSQRAGGGSEDNGNTFAVGQISIGLKTSSGL